MFVSCGPTPGQGYLLAHETPLGELEKDACSGQRQPCWGPLLMSEHELGFSLCWPLVLVLVCRAQPKTRWRG